MSMMLRWSVMVVFVLAAACGDDDGGGTDSGPMCRPNGNPCAADGDCCSGACGGDGLCGTGGGGDAGGTDGGGGGDDGGGSGAAPTITRIAWAAAASCTAGSASDFDITVTVTDADTAAGDLAFTGNVTGCTGAIDAASSTIRCPNAAPYGGMVTVTDPESNSDSQSFNFGPCETGGADF